jgi:hypothetical protein
VGTESISALSVYLYIRAVGGAGSLPTSYPLLYTIPTLYLSVCCSLLWLRSRETSQSNHVIEEHFVELGAITFPRNTSESGETSQSNHVIEEHFVELGETSQSNYVIEEHFVELGAITFPRNTSESGDFAITLFKNTSESWGGLILPPFFYIFYRNFRFNKFKFITSIFKNSFSRQSKNTFS